MEQTAFFFSGKIRDRMRECKIRGSEPEREGPEPGERAGGDAQGRGESQGDRKTTQGGSCKLLLHPTHIPDLVTTSTVSNLLQVKNSYVTSNIQSYCFILV